MISIDAADEILSARLQPSYPGHVGESFPWPPAAPHIPHPPPNEIIYLFKGLGFSFLPFFFSDSPWWQNMTLNFYALPHPVYTERIQQPKASCTEHATPDSYLILQVANISLQLLFVIWFAFLFQGFIHCSIRNWTWVPGQPRQANPEQLELLVQNWSVTYLSIFSSVLLKLWSHNYTC